MPDSAGRPELSAAVAAGVAAAIAVGGLLVPLRGDVTNATIVLVFVVVVVGAAALGGPWAGAATAVSAALSFDFFFTRPYWSLTISSADDVETTVLLAMSGIIVGTVASWGRRGRRAAAIGSSEIRRIHRVAEAVATGLPVDDVVRMATKEVQELLHLSECRFEATSVPGSLPRLERNGGIGTRELHLARSGFELPAGGAELAVLSRGQQVGRFVLIPSPGVGVSLERRVVTVAIADQLGGVLTAPVPPLSD